MRVTSLCNIKCLILLNGRLILFFIFCVADKNKTRLIFTSISLYWRFDLKKKREVCISLSLMTSLPIIFYFLIHSTAPACVRLLLKPNFKNSFPFMFWRVLHGRCSSKNGIHHNAKILDQKMECNFWPRKQSLICDIF